MKTNLLLSLTLFVSVSSPAQGVFRNQTSAALEKVVQDYSNQFKNIKGELLSNHQGVSEYKSTVVIPGTTSGIIMQSTTANRQAVDWQAVLFTADDFDQAKTHFEEFFNQIKNTIIRPVGQRAIIVNGMYIDPATDKPLTTIQFDMLPPNGVLQNLHIDLSLSNKNNKWNILLNVYDKELSTQETMMVK